MVAVEKQAARSGSRCVGQGRSLAALPHEKIAPPAAAVNLLWARQVECIPTVSRCLRSRQHPNDHGYGLTCPARYAGNAIHCLDTNQYVKLQDAQTEQSWFLSDSSSLSKQKRLKWLYRPIETHGVPNYAEGGIRRTQFADVHECPSSGF